MKTVDTNVLVRILVDDTKQAEQNKLARQFAKKAKRLFVPQIVQVELVWVLAVAYQLEKQEIVAILRHLEENEAFTLQHEESYMDALAIFQADAVDFSDCLIAVESKKAGYQVVTFDKKFSRLTRYVSLIN